jgi:hypothetical protein
LAINQEGFCGRNVITLAPVRKQLDTATTIRLLFGPTRFILCGMDLDLIGERFIPLNYLFTKNVMLAKKNPPTFTSSAFLKSDRTPTNTQQPIITRSRQIAPAASMIGQ